MRSDPIAEKRKPNPYPGRLYLIFVTLALFSTIGLDYAAARRGEKAYFFASRAARKEAVIIPVPLAESLRPLLGTFSIPAESVEELEDADGTPRIVGHLPPATHRALA